jgi:phosphate transport system ATP-binding protein
MTALTATSPGPAPHPAPARPWVPPPPSVPTVRQEPAHNPADAPLRQQTGPLTADPAHESPQPEPPVKAEAIGLRFSYGRHEVLKGIDLPIRANRITALIGPSGCGKSTLLRCFNRMHDLYPDTHYGGKLLLYPDKLDICGKGVDPILLRLRINMVFQKPNPFPKSVYENVAFGPRLRGQRSGRDLDAQVEEALKGAALWDEVKDRLSHPAYKLSGGQQQRLCIARALASSPEIILFDEPTSALDPVATLKIEELILGLAQRTTIVIVTHNMHQAARVSDYTAFMYLGELVEFDRTSTIFQRPRNDMTQKYVTGHFG